MRGQSGSVDPALGGATGQKPSTNLDPKDATVERRFRRIPEYGGRVLRVAVTTAIEANRVVSVFFDRQMKGKL